MILTDAHALHQWGVMNKIVTKDTLSQEDWVANYISSRLNKLWQNYLVNVLC